MPFVRDGDRFSFALTDNVVRSCYIQPDPIEHRFYHINDLAEADLFLHLKHLV
ncbi:hypothetical protein BT69DRAFT_1275318 [Atractiella rhizophila]|nr:hypothetical protein BT69DRAFT_1275318 [Atractiella rhizophila]